MFKFKMVHTGRSIHRNYPQNPNCWFKPQKAKVGLHCVWNVKSQGLSKQAQDKGSAKFANFDNF